MDEEMKTLLRENNAMLKRIVAYIDDKESLRSVINNKIEQMVGERQVI